MALDHDACGDYAAQPPVHGLAGLLWLAAVFALERDLVLSRLGRNRRSVLLDSAAPRVGLGHRPSLVAAQRRRDHGRLGRSYYSAVSADRRGGLPPGAAAVRPDGGCWGGRGGPVLVLG